MSVGAVAEAQPDAARDSAAPLVERMRAAAAAARAAADEVALPRREAEVQRHDPRDPVSGVCSAIAFLSLDKDAQFAALRTMANCEAVTFPCHPVVLDCALCLTPYARGDALRRAPCEGGCHVFHHQCLRAWVDRGNDSCPLCRGKLTAPKPKKPPSPPPEPAPAPRPPGLRPALTPR